MHLPNAKAEKLRVQLAGIELKVVYFFLNFSIYSNKSVGVGEYGRIPHACKISIKFSEYKGNFDFRLPMAPKQFQVVFSVPESYTVCAETRA